MNYETIEVQTDDASTDSKSTTMYVTFRRAGQFVICDKCGKPFGKHPAHHEFDWLNVACNGDLVKL